MANSIAKQKKMLQFLRTSNIYSSKENAELALKSIIPSTLSDSSCDGTPILARYLDGVEVKTLIGLIYSDGDNYSITTYDDGTDTYEELSQQISDMMNAAGLDVVDDVISYIADPDRPILSGATTLKNADEVLEDALLELSGIVQTNEVKIVSATPTSEDVLKSYKIVNSDGEQLGETIDIPKDKFLKSAALVTPKQDPKLDAPVLRLVFVTADGTEDIVDLPIKDLIELTDVASDVELQAVELNLGGVYDEETSAFTVTFSGVNTSSYTTIYDAIEALDDELLKIQNQVITSDDPISAITDDEGNTNISLNYVHVNENQTAGLTLTNDEGINKLDIDFDFGSFEFVVVYVETAEDIENIEDKPNANIVITTTDALNAASGVEFKSVTLKSNTDKTINLVANENVVVKDMTVSGDKGSTNGKITYKTPSMYIENVNVENGSTVYNVFEGDQTNVKLDELYATKVVVDNPSLSHNVFNVYQPADNAVINITDSTFNLNVSNSNILRLSNYKNSSNVTVNIENVEWTYENAPYGESDKAWAGLVIYQPAGADAALGGDLSYLKTWKFNFKNCKYNGVKVTDNNFGEINQVFYLYNIDGDKKVSNPIELGLDVNFE